MKAKGLLSSSIPCIFFCKKRPMIFRRALIPGLILNHQTDKDRAYANHLIALYNLEPYIIRAPFVKDVSLYYSISSLVISPLLSLTSPVLSLNPLHLVFLRSRLIHL